MSARLPPCTSARQPPAPRRPDRIPSLSGRTPMAGNPPPPGASVGSRLLSLLGAYDAEHRSLSLSELARRADLPVPTAYRLVGELTAWGALVRQPSGDYVVGRRLWDL